ncbi:MAG: hypothetical protein P1P87_11520, partial [Trueperaceae bacterium]|nr:hypothetical protein [Trueperaceae bacterium]
LVAWLTRAFPASVERVAPPVLAFANLGPVAAAPLVGAVVAWAGPTVVPTVLLGFAAVVALLAWSIRRATAS